MKIKSLDTWRHLLTTSRWQKKRGEETIWRGWTGYRERGLPLPRTTRKHPKGNLNRGRPTKRVRTHSTKTQLKNVRTIRRLWWYYWNSPFDRTCSYNELAPTLRALLPGANTMPSILIVGCGDAPFLVDLFLDGFHDTLDVIITIITQRITPVNYLAYSYLLVQTQSLLTLPCIDAQQGCNIPRCNRTISPLSPSVPASLVRNCLPRNSVYINFRQV